MEFCWSTIGVRGDGSCGELRHHVHCRNCPVHAAAATQLLEAAPAIDYLSSWTDHVSAPKTRPDPHALSVVIFRVDAEWFALPTPVVEEVTRAVPIHSVPHRRSDVLLGVTNIRGELTPCVSLGRLLGLQESENGDPQALRGWRQRCLVIRSGTLRISCPVHDVPGIQRVPQQDLKDVPATVARAATRYSRGTLSWREHTVGVLDEQPLFATLRRSLA